MSTTRTRPRLAPATATKRTAKPLATSIVIPQLTSRSTSSTAPAKKKRAFIVMPFADEYEPVFKAIKRACDNSGIEAIRADEIMQPGPIINQIYDTIAKADCVIGEIGSRNPNVYYEIALAHCAELPSVLLTSQDKVDSIPFDLRHNRVIPYDSKEPATLVDPLSQALTYLKDAVLEHQIQPTLEDHLLSQPLHELSVLA